MTSLLPDEARAFGTLIEKAQTVPAQYPLTLNSLLLGINQRSNRDPVVELDEGRVLDAIDGLRAKGFAREVAMTGSRVPKFRHLGREALEISAGELAILAELLLRGPQTAAELRSRGSRMHPIESAEVAAALLDSLRQRPSPLLEELPPIPGTRATRFRQLLCPDLHPLAPASGGVAAPDADGVKPAAVARLEAIEAEVAQLRERLESLERSLGMTGGMG
jgi:uncharacterized protein YceH (UPF0502 family)